MLKEFKKFALKGNVVDLAVGVVIGGAFGKIVTSLVNDIVMPLLGLAIGKVNFSKLNWMIEPAVLDAEGNVVTPALALKYGQFIQTTIDFLIIAFSIFLAIKLLTRFKKKEEEKVAAPPEPTKEEVLLTEIRDLLKQK